MERPTAIIGKAYAAYAPQRKNKRRRAPRIAFPDPYCHRKPQKARVYVHASGFWALSKYNPQWMIARHLMDTRLFNESQACKARKEARAAVRAARRTAQQSNVSTAQAATLQDD